MQGSQRTSLRGQAIQQWGSGAGEQRKVNLGPQCQHSSCPVSQKGCPGRPRMTSLCSLPPPLLSKNSALRASSVRSGICWGLAQGLLASQFIVLGSVPGELSALFM